MNNKLLATIAAIILAGPMAANAVPITTSVGTFEFSVVEDNFADISGLLQSQVWWGSDALATEFAQLTGEALGLSTLNSAAFHENIGPLFAFCNNSILGSGCAFQISQFPVMGYAYSFDRSTPDFQALDFIATDNTFVHAYAIATRVESAVPEPGTLALFALGLAGLGFVRRSRSIGR